MKALCTSWALPAEKIAVRALPREAWSESSECDSSWFHTAASLNFRLCYLMNDIIYHNDHILSV